MSAIADFRLIETSRLNDLRDNAEIKIEKKLFSKKVIDKYWDYLDSISKKIENFDGSGYIFGNLLVFLEEKKGIDLLKSSYDEIVNSIVEKRQTSAFIFTFDHRQKYLDKLDPDNFTIDELITFNKEFSEDDDMEFAKAEIDAIKLLQDNLKLLTGDNIVILLNVG
ncbi:MAG: hypothetical protein WCT51_04765 [Candidatus Shapirobacteria bacterium]